MKLQFPKNSLFCVQNHLQKFPSASILFQFWYFCIAFNVDHPWIKSWMIFQFLFKYNRSKFLGRLKPLPLHHVHFTCLSITAQSHGLHSPLPSRKRPHVKVHGVGWVQVRCYAHGTVMKCLVFNFHPMQLSSHNCESPTGSLRIWWED